MKLVQHFERRRRDVPPVRYRVDLPAISEDGRRD